MSCKVVPDEIDYSFARTSTQRKHIQHQCNKRNAGKTDANVLKTYAVYAGAPALLFDSTATTTAVHSWLYMFERGLSTAYPQRQL
jgi:hypothetical protein